jgi:hypothetical protein
MSKIADTALISVHNLQLVLLVTDWARQFFCTRGNRVSLSLHGSHCSFIILSIHSFILKLWSFDQYIGWPLLWPGLRQSQLPVEAHTKVFSINSEQRIPLIFWCLLQFRVFRTPNRIKCIWICISWKDTKKIFQFIEF